MDGHSRWRVGWGGPPPLHRTKKTAANIHGKNTVFCAANAAKLSYLTSTNIIIPLARKTPQKWLV